MAFAAFWCRICFRFFTMCGAGPMVLRSLHVLVSHVRRCAMTVGDVRCMHFGGIHSSRWGEHSAHDTSHPISISVKSCTIRQSYFCWVQLARTIVLERVSLGLARRIVGFTQIRVVTVNEKSGTDCMFSSDSIKAGTIKKLVAQNSS